MTLARETLGRSALVAAALRMLDARGLAGLSMRGLADDLGVAPSALYWHVPNKQSLLGAVADEILARSPAVAESDRSDVDTSGSRRRLVADECEALRRALLDVRDGADIVASSYAFGLGGADAHRRLVAVVERAGVADPGPAASALLHFVFGFTVNEQQRTTAAGLGAALGDRTHYSDRTFTLALHVVLDGVDAAAR